MKRVQLTVAVLTVLACAGTAVVPSRCACASLPTAVAYSPVDCAFAPAARPPYAVARLPAP